MISDCARVLISFSFATLAFFATENADAQTLAPSTSAEVPAASEPRSLALEHFEKGKTLFRAGSIAPALAEFLASRRLYPTRNATANAALCLVQLQRFDEALDMYELLLKEFPDMPDELKIPAQREVIRLRGLVGTIDVTGAEVGAAISIDGNTRGDYPPIAPLRVSAGSHIVRVYKEGFEPFEGRIDVAGGETARVMVRLRVLQRLGRVRVAEQNNRILDVIMDGSIVGKTPWEGPLAPGNHTVLLRGEGNVGTQPASISVRFGETTPLVLVAEDLPAILRVEPTPAGASVAIDSVIVGRGIWEGRLRAGEHKIEVLAEGFYASVERARLDPGERETLSIALRRDTTSPMWRKPSKLTLELGTSLPLAPSFGGGVAGTCEDGCSRGLGLGGLISFRGGYELGSGWGFGIGAGYVNLWQTVSNRPEALAPVGFTPRQGFATDTLNLRGLLASMWVGYLPSDTFPLRLRLHGGALFGSLLDERRFASGGETFGPAGVISSATFLHLTPEVRFGFRLGKSLELSAGVEVPVLMRLSTNQWDPDLPIDAGADGIGYFAAADLVDPVVVVISPGIGVRYEF